MTEKTNNHKGLFDFYGKISFKESIPLAFQHVIAMIAGCITPAILVGGAAGLAPEDLIVLIQMSLVGSALTTMLMLYPIKKIGAKLPIIFGVSFAYVPSMIAIAGQFNNLDPKDIIAIIFGAQIIGAVASVLFGMGLKYMLPLFPPLVSGTVVLVIGLSLYPVAMNYIGGGGDVTMAGWGSPQNFLVGGITLIIGILASNFGKGMIKLSSVLFSIICGYILAFFFNMVDLSPVRDATWFTLIKPLHFGIKFDLSAIVSITIIFIVTAIEAIGDMTSTTVGGMDRVPTDKELKGGIIGYGIANIFGAVLNCLPTATFSQNVGIVSTNKVVNRSVFLHSSIIILIAGLFPKLSSILTTIPYPVLGGATLSVFAAITMNGIRMITSQPLSARNTSIVGISVAIGVGFTTVAGAAANAGVNFMSQELAVAIGSSPVVLAAICAVLMNKLIPEKEEDRPKQNELEEVYEELE